MRYPLTGHLYNVDKHEKICTKLYTVLYTVLTGNYNINSRNLSTLNYLNFSPYGCIVLSFSILMDSLLSLSFGSQWSIIWKCMLSIEPLCSKSKKWEIIFSSNSPRIPWLYKLTFDLCWLNLSLSLATLVSVYWRPHTVQDRQIESSSYMISLSQIFSRN